MSDCVFNYNLPVGNDGYPRLHSKRLGNTTSAIKVLWEQAYGPIDAGYEPDHVVCNNKTCINIEHVKIVTSAENNSRAHRKLEREDVLAIKAQLEKKVPYRVLTGLYGVSQATISNINTGKFYRWVK